MNFKDEYQKVNQHIVPDETFQKQMLSKMRQMETVDKEMVTETNKWYQQPSFVAICFLILVMMVGGIMLWGGIEDANQQTAKTDPFDVNVGNMTTESVLKNSEDATTKEKGGIFSPKMWYKEDATAEEIYQSFYQRLSDMDGLDTVYESKDDDTFEESERMLEEDVLKLRNRLVSGQNSNKPYVGSSKVYYMVKCKDGVIIKFEIYDNQLLKFSDVSTIYEY